MGGGRLYWQSKVVFLLVNCLYMSKLPLFRKQLGCFQANSHYIAIQKLVDLRFFVENHTLFTQIYIGSMQLFCCRSLFCLLCRTSRSACDCC